MSPVSCRFNLLIIFFILFENFTPFLLDIIIILRRLDTIVFGKKNISITINCTDQLCDALRLLLPNFKFFNVYFCNISIIQFTIITCD